MGLWGFEWGELWGGPIPPIETHEDDAKDRLAFQFRDDETFQNFLGVLAGRTQTVENLLEDVEPSLLYDLDTAFGEQLNVAGRVLGLNRAGFTDDEYRVFLKAQALIALPRRRTVDGFLDLLRALLNDDTRTITYSEFRPKTFQAVVQNVTVDELALWRPFLQRSRPVTYNLLFVVAPVGAFGYGDATATVAPTVQGFGDATGTVAGGGQYAWLFPFP